MDKEKINIVTLGCSKNVVDSEVLFSQLKGNKKCVCHEEESSDAGTVVINTCGFIDQAKEQSIRTILNYAELKKRGAIEKLVVTGCLSERYKDDLKDQIPEVDAFFGTHDLPDLLKNLDAQYKEELVGEREPTENSHYAYLKVSEGCDRGCSFCAIPLMRGKHTSREMDFLVKEVEYLVSKGVKEIMLIAQDLTYYGVDIYRKRKLNELLQRLSDVEGLEWIRLHYAYPSNFPLDILPTIAERDNICNYLDMPLQHIADEVLKKMRRRIDRARTEKLIATIRDSIPGIAIRSTLLVGHPGETDAHHQELLAFLEETRLERVGVFAYSHEENTKSHEYEDDVPEDVKQQRVDDVMRLQQQISLSLNEKKVGQFMRILVDRVDEEGSYGRSEFDSPEVDNEVILPGEQLEVGSFYTAEVTAAKPYDLIAKAI